MQDIGQINFKIGRGMGGYPVVLQLKGWRCLVVGGGQVARRKTADLFNADARVMIVSPQVDPVLAEWAELKWIEVHYQPYTPALLTRLQPRLVFAATDSAETNGIIARDAEAQGMLVNVADDPAASSFFNMAVIQRQSLMIAVSTQGHSPALAKHLKTQIEQVVGDEYAILSQWMGMERERVQQMLTEQNQRAGLWHRILTSPVLTLIRAGQTETAYQHFQQMISEALNP